MTNPKKETKAKKAKKAKVENNDLKHLDDMANDPYAFLFADEPPAEDVEGHAAWLETISNDITKALSRTEMHVSHGEYKMTYGVPNVLHMLRTKSDKLMEVLLSKLALDPNGTVTLFGNNNDANNPIEVPLAMFVDSEASARHVLNKVGKMPQLGRYTLADTLDERQLKEFGAYVENCSPNGVLPSATQERQFLQDIHPGILTSGMTQVHKIVTLLDIIQKDPRA